MDFVDLIIIGGGVTGAGVARDAALRGIKALGGFFFWHQSC